MNKGEEVNHRIYGKAVVVDTFRERKNHDDKVIQTKGVSLELLTDDGKTLYARHRGGVLPYLFEDDFSKITKV